MESLEINATKNNLLVVDDDQRVVKKVAKAFENSNISVFGVQNLKGALDLLGKIRFSIIILDVVLDPKTPSKDLNRDLESIQKIQEISPKSSIIVLSQFRDVNTISESIKRGATHYLWKGTWRPTGKEFKKFINSLLEEDKTKFSFRLPVKEELVIPLFKYILSFEDYLKDVKGLSIDIKIKYFGESIGLEYRAPSISHEKVIIDYFAEYLQLIFINQHIVTPKFEVFHPNKKKDLILDDLNNEINSLRNKISILEQKAALLKDENKFLRELSKNMLVDKPTRAKKREIISNIDSLKKRIGKGEIFAVIGDFIEYAPKGFPDLVNELYLYQASLKRLMDRKRKNIISEDFFAMELSKVEYSVLSLLDSANS